MHSARQRTLFSHNLHTLTPNLFDLGATLYHFCCVLLLVSTRVGATLDAWAAVFTRFAARFDMFSLGSIPTLIQIVFISTQFAVKFY